MIAVEGIEIYHASNNDHTLSGELADVNAKRNFGILYPQECLGGAAVTVTSSVMNVVTTQRYDLYEEKKIGEEYPTILLPKNCTAVAILHSKVRDGVRVVTKDVIRNQGKRWEIEDQILRCVMICAHAPYDVFIQSNSVHIYHLRVTRHGDVSLEAPLR